jgi:hypothetical protein
VSVLIAIGAASIALWLAFKNTRLVERLVASVFMGFAIAAMHYAAMQGARFTPHSGIGSAHVHADVDCRLSPRGAEGAHGRECLLSRPQGVRSVFCNIITASVRAQCQLNRCLGYGNVPPVLG